MIKKILKKMRDLVVEDFRSKILSDLIVNKIIKYNKQKNIKILDYGSGFQPNVIWFVYDKLTRVYKKKVIVDCYDFYTLKQLAELNKKKKITSKFLSNKCYKIE